MIGKFAPRLILGGVLTLLVLSASSFAQTVDGVPRPVRFGLMPGLSPLLLRSHWRHRADDSETHQTVPKDMADDFLAAARRWFYGGQN